MGGKDHGAKSREEGGGRQENNGERTPFPGSSSYDLKTKGDFREIWVSKDRANRHRSRGEWENQETQRTEQKDE